MNPDTLQRHSHWLNPGPDATPAQYWEAAARFTNACCFEERATYRLIAKDGDGSCFHPQQPIVCDKLANMASGRVYDMVASAGTAQQAPQFVETTQSVQGNQMVHPYDPASYGPPPPTEPPPMTNAPGPYPPYPGDQAFDPLGQALFADYAEAHHEPNPAMSRWYGRVIYDWLTGICPTMEASINKHRNDWRTELGLPPKASSVG